MTNEEIILKSVQAHLTPVQRHEIAAAAYTPEQIAHAVEHIPDGLDELAASQVHTFAWWKDNGKSVKRGEKALFTCPLWKYTDKPSKAQIKAAEAAGKEVQPAVHYYPTTSYMFSCLQVESSKPAPAGRFKSIDEIKAYNKMLAEQRRAARVSAAIKTAAEAIAQDVTTEARQAAQQAAAKPLTGKYAKLRDDLKAALAAGRTVEDDDPEDGGACNFDAASLLLPRWKEALVEQAAQEAGTGCFTWSLFGKKRFVFRPNTNGQANARSRNAEAMTDALARMGYQAFCYQQLD